ncbi:MAG TPA: sulfur carrier protein ThiS [Solirubrobacteraceae bacterium]
MITLNGAPSDGEGLTIAELLARMEVPDRGVAVAVDAEVVPRGAWERTVLGDGAAVEVVTAVQGG